MRHIVILWHILLIPLWGYSQICGRTDTTIVTRGNTFNIPITIAPGDLLNDDLSDPGQGLCGIELTFTHQYITDLNLTLISPAGQQVQLTGPTDLSVAAPQTFFSRWRIRFIPSGETAEPDPNFTPRWDNMLNLNNYISLGLYTGSYYPYSGNLEDFNTGSVSGTWTLLADNSTSFNDGAVFGIRLLFCDPTGLDCCFADAGRLEDEDLLVCEGSDGLNYSPLINQAFPQPDPDQYGYTYLVSRDSILLYYDSTSVDLSGFPAGSYQVCGLSYLRADSLLLPPPDGQYTLGELYADLNSLSPSFCADLTGDCQEVIIEAPPPPVDTLIRVCEGVTVSFLDSIYSTPGTYPYILRTAGGCDSLINVTIAEIPTIVNPIDSTVCAGESVQIGNSVYTTEGTYRDTLVSSLGCDSIVLLNLAVLNDVNISRNEAICRGDSLIIGGEVFRESGDFQVILPAANGCDSIIDLFLVVLDPQIQLQPVDTITCARPEVLLDASASTPPGLLAFAWSDIDGNVLGETTGLTVSTPGDYVLTLTQEQFGRSCAVSDTITVPGDQSFPVADAGPPQALTCDQPAVRIGGSNTSLGPEYLYEWSTDTGSFMDSPNLPDPSVDGPGEYTLVVININSTCRDTARVQVTDDQVLPVVETLSDTVLTCSVPSIILTSDGSSRGGSFSYAWRDDQGAVLGNGESLPVDRAGTYYLEITDTKNNCTAVDSVEVSLSQSFPLAAVLPPDTITCAQLFVTLDGRSSSPSGLLTYSWRGPGINGTVSDPEVVVDQAGDYVLRVTNTVSLCEDSITVPVVAAQESPLVDAGPRLTLDCNTPGGEIGSANTAVGPEFVYEWIAIEGLLPGPTDLPVVPVDGEGIYRLRVTDTRNGCRDSSTVVVIEDLEQPGADAGLDQLLDCGTSAVTLDGSASVQGADIVYAWSGPCLPGPTDSVATVADCPGTYVLTVTNTRNGCSRTDTVQVNLNTAAPVAVLPDTAFIDCADGTAVLDGAASTSGFYEWTKDGSIVPPGGDRITVNETGLYILTVTNQDGSCSDQDSILVLSDCRPQAVISAPERITCQNPTTTLDGRASAGSSLTYRWEAPDPSCILSGQDTPVLEVSCGGAYTLIVSNELVMQRDTQTVTVEMEDNMPVAVLGPPDTLTCLQREVLLDGSASSSGPNTIYRWTRVANDALIAQTPSTITTVPGTFRLEVIDTASQCSATAAIRIVEFNLPITVSLTDSLIGCAQDTFPLRAIPTPLSDFYTYQWSGPDILAQADNATVLAGGPGVYTVLVTDGRSECQASATATLTEDPLCAPCVSTSTPDAITCDRPLVTLEAAYCRDCTGCVLQWTSADGNIVDGVNTLQPTVDRPGTYRLTVINQEGFQTAVEVTVTANNTDPLALAGPDRRLSCDSSSVHLGDTGAVPATGVVYSWNSPDNPAAVFAAAPSILVDRPGLYALEVRDTLTGCFSLDTTVVTYDTLPPVAVAGPDRQLTCNDSFVILDAGGSSSGNEFSYSWRSDQAGSCLQGSTAVSPIVSCPGTYYLEVRNERSGCTATDSLLVSAADDLPVLVPLPDTALICGLDSIELTGNLPATGTYSFSWCALDAGGQEIAGSCVPELSLRVGDPGNYRYTVIDQGSGCAASLVVTVADRRGAPVIDAGPDLVLDCAQDSAVLSAVLGPDLPMPDIQWSSLGGQPIAGANTLNPVIYAPDTLVLEVINAETNCRALDTLVVTRDAKAPLANGGPDTVLSCSAPTLELSGDGVSSGGNTVRYQWTTVDGSIRSGGNTATPLIDLPGIYVLRVTDNQNACTATDTVMVAADQNAPTALLANPDQLVLSCLADSVLLDASPSFSAGGGALEYAWSVLSSGSLSGPNDQVTALADAIGTYRLVVTDPDNGCRDSLRFTVSAALGGPVIRIAPVEALTCVRTEVTIDAGASEFGAAYSASWLDVQGNVLATDELTLTVSEAGSYSLRIDNNESGCSNISDPVTVALDTLAPQVEIADPDLLDCAVNSITLDGRGSSAGGSILYAWSSDDGLLLGATDQIEATAAAPGAYRLQVTNARNGCTGEDSVQVEAITTPIAGVVVEVSGPGCVDERSGSLIVTEVLGGTPPFVYQLDAGAERSDGTFVQIAAGTYTLRIRDNNGCEWKETVVLPEPEPIDVDLGLDLTIISGDSVRLEAQTSSSDIVRYRWDPPVADGPVAVVAPEISTGYSLTVTDSKGCTATARVRVTVQQSRPYYIPTAFSPDGDGNNDRFTVLTGPEVVNIPVFRIYNRWGHLVYERLNIPPNDPQLGWDGRHNGTALNGGVFVYYVELEYNDGWVEPVKGDITLLR